MDLIIANSDVPRNTKFRSNTKGELCLKKLPEFRIYYLAGVEGFEPSHTGIKIRCLNRLATPLSKTVSILTDQVIVLKAFRFKRVL